MADSPLRARVSGPRWGRPDGMLAGPPNQSGPALPCPTRPTPQEAHWADSTVAWLLLGRRGPGFRPVATLRRRAGSPPRTLGVAWSTCQEESGSPSPRSLRLLEVGVGDTDPRVGGYLPRTRRSPACSLASPPAPSWSPTASGPGAPFPPEAPVGAVLWQESRVSPAAPASALSFFSLMSPKSDHLFLTEG